MDDHKSCGCGNPLPRPCRVECDECNEKRRELIELQPNVEREDLAKEDTLMTEF